MGVLYLCVIWFSYDINAAQINEKYTYFIFGSDLAFVATRF